jgi:hypothetical protein
MEKIHAEPQRNQRYNDKKTDISESTGRLRAIFVIPPSIISALLRSVFSRALG